MVKEFSKEAIDNLKYYVYKLIDPRDGKVFYIGKGKGNRVFSHINLSLRYESRDEEISDKMKYWAEKACEAAGVTTYARVDMLMNEDEEIFCLEINTLPGMTPTSLIPQEAAAVGMSYDQLKEKIVEISLAKYN